MRRITQGCWVWLSGLASGLLLATLTNAVALGWFRTFGVWLALGAFFVVAVGSLAMALHGAFDEVEDGTEQWKRARLRLVRKGDE